nr:transglycosylase SLT domain-containing protein [uncultured Albidiferax sp.]
MKFIHFASLSALLWLTGCATVGPKPDAVATATSPANPSGQPTSALPVQPHTAVYPRGVLQPITAAEAASRGVAQLKAPADLWERIRRGFAMPNLQSDLVSDREQWYSTRPDYIQRMTERSSKYLFHVVEELERRNMPTELALLPYIESAFNPQAVSSAKAAGMWQFMPATGNYFELKQNIFRDDRRDVLASTRAALDYLQKLYGMFGDWQLALAAYNWGEGSVSRAIARNQKAGLGITYSELNMPAETRLYVPKLQAVKNIIANPDMFRTELPLIENHPYFQSVDISRDIDVALAAKLANVKLDDFKALNPSAHRNVILAAGTPQILLPWDSATVFTRNLEAYTQGQYASWSAWTVPSTMSVSAAAQQVGMSEYDLRSVNNIPPRMLIKAGSALIVPRSASMQDVSEHVADTAQLSLSPEIVNRKAAVKAGKRDTVASIAKRYGVSASNVADWNDLKLNAGFKVGQQVVLYLPVRLSTPRSAGRSKVQAVARTHEKAAPSAKASGTRKSSRADTTKVVKTTRKK